jgi:hypothetical protein
LFENIKMKTMKTKTKIALAITSLMIAFSTFAQVGMRGGIVGGVSTGPVQLENLDKRFTDVINGNNITGFEAGVFLKPYIGSFYIKPEALYQFSGGNVNYYTESTGSGQQTTYFSMHKVEVPILIGYKILGPLYIEAGPSYNYIFGLTNSYNENTIAINQSALGYRVGVGAELGPLLLSLNMAGATYLSTDNNKATFKEPYKVIFGLGFFLGGNNDSHKKHESRSKKNDDSDTDKKNDSDSR